MINQTENTHGKLKFWVKTGPEVEMWPILRMQNRKMAKIV